MANYLSVQPGQVDTVFRTLSYVDAVNPARRAVTPDRFSVALMATVCPPATVYTASNIHREHTGTVDNTIDVWPFNDHEDGAGHQWARRLPWLAGLPRP